VHLKVSGALLAGALAAGAAAMIAHADGSHAGAAATEGGLSISPVSIERQAAAGASNVVTVANHSNGTLKVTVKARPWTQSSSGLVAPNRRVTLRGVAVSEGSFTLAPGAGKDVTVTMSGAPAGGSLYGALEVVGMPASMAKKGVVTAYRLVGALRYNPATPVYAFKVGAAKIVKRGASKTLTLALRSTGNTTASVRGSLLLRGPLGSRQGSVKATRILPGKSIALALASAKKLMPGRYTATVTLHQGTFEKSYKKKITLRR
jgi:hypothetical protein